MITEKFANKLGYSDINPFEIVRVISEKTLEIRKMNAEKDPSWEPKWVDGGFAGHCLNQYDQKWFITPDQDAPVFRIRLSKARGWRDANGNSYKLGDQPVKFYDYNF